MERHQQEYIGRRREYLELCGPARSGNYEMNVHFVGLPNRRGMLATAKVSIEEIFSLLDYLEHESQEMTFDDYPGTVTKVEINVAKKQVVLRVKLYT